MLEICALASGSNGNSYYIGNEDEAILVDAGISTKQLLLRMKSRGLNSSKVRAVFLSHEHSDHARGIQVLSKRLAVEIWMSKRTWRSLPATSRPLWVKFFEPGETVTIGSFEVHTFLKNHDASEPSSFRISHKEKSVGVFTDIGSPCDQVKTALTACHAAFMETNYDETMLWKGPYPWPLKQRVASDVGHLSNEQAFQLVREYGRPHLECLFLSHLSGENNTPAKAYAAFKPLNSKMEIRLTSRHDASEVYRLKKGCTL